MFLSRQSPRSAGIIKEQLITHNPHWARCLLCWSGQIVCVCVCVCQYLPPLVPTSSFLLLFLLFVHLFLLSLFLCGEFVNFILFHSPSVLLHLSPLFPLPLFLSVSLSASLPTNLFIPPSLSLSSPPSLLLSHFGSYSLGPGGTQS